MLLKQRVLNGIVEGRISLAFRRWKRATVKAGGSLRTAIGVLAIEAVDVVTEDGISKQDATNAGYLSRDDLLAELNKRSEGKLYRITLHYAGSDPRQELREQDDMSDHEMNGVITRLAKMDASSRRGPWTTMTLRLIANNPGKRAVDLAESTAMEKNTSKRTCENSKNWG